jgi:hypothetical protein
MHISLNEFWTNVFLEAFSDRMELVVSEYFIAGVDVLHTVVTKVSQDGGILLVRNRVFNSLSIDIPCAESYEMIPSYAFRWVMIESDSFIYKL